MNATMTRQIQAYRATASPMPVCPFISRQVAVAAAQAVERVGMPEAQIILAQAAAYIACAPKSNAAVNAIASAMKTVEETGEIVLSRVVIPSGVR